MIIKILAGYTFSEETPVASPSLLWLQVSQDLTLKTLDQGEKDYKSALFAVSTQNHPFTGVSMPQSSAALEEKLNNIHATLVKIANDCDINDKYKLLNRFKKRISKIAILCDAWWMWATESANFITGDPELLKWMLETVLPYFYWKNQLNKSKRKPAMRYHYNKLLLSP